MRMLHCITKYNQSLPIYKNINIQKPYCLSPKISLKLLKALKMQIIKDADGFDLHINHQDIHICMKENKT